MRDTMNTSRILIGIIAALGIVLVISALSKPGQDTDTIMRFIYLGIIGTMVGSWVLAEMRGNVGESVRNLLIWGVIIVVIMLGYEYRGALGF